MGVENSFNFYKSYHEIGQKLSDKAFGEYVRAMCEYYFENEIVHQPKNKTVQMLLPQVKATLDSRKMYSELGKRSASIRHDLSSSKSRVGNAVGNHVGNAVGNHVGNHVGNAVGNHVGNHVGNNINKNNKNRNKNVEQEQGNDYLYTSTTIPSIDTHTNLIHTPNIATVDTKSTLPTPQEIETYFAECRLMGNPKAFLDQLRASSGDVSGWRDMAHEYSQSLTKKADSQ